MANILVLVAAIFFVAAIIVAVTTDNSWKHTITTWVILGIGCVFFGIALTLK